MKVRNVKPTSRTNTMKKRNASSIVTTATIALIGATPALAVPPPPSIPPAVPLDATSSLVVEPEAAGFSAHFSRLKKMALLAKHDLLSEVNRVEQLDGSAHAAAPGLLATREAPALLRAAPFAASRLPVTSATGETRAPDFAALSNTAVKAKRPSGTDGRNFGKRNRWT
jgi:hypothetical protein